MQGLQEKRRGRGIAVAGAEGAEGDGVEAPQLQQQQQQQQQQQHQQQQQQQQQWQQQQQRQREQQQHLQQEKQRKQSAIRRDLPSLVLLLLLYTLQGLPMGLGAAVPFLLQAHPEVTYASQALFSLCSLPFSLKLLWAPLVDALYVRRWGRRKSWLVPVQLLAALLMLAAGGTGGYVDQWVGGGGAEFDRTGTFKPMQHEATGASSISVPTLVVYFLALYFLMATQDIAVDGWAITMLSRETVGYASTTNTIGQNLGFFFANIGFIFLSSARLCNKYLRVEPQDTGVVTLGSFLTFWGIVIVSITAYIMVFKREHTAPTATVAPTASVAASIDDASGGSQSGISGTASNQGGGASALANGNNAPENGGTSQLASVVHTYKLLWKVLWLPSVLQFCAVLLTCKVPFAVVDSATTLKVTEYGMPREHLALWSPVSLACGLLIPIFISKFTAGPRPMDVFLLGVPFRLLVGLFYGVLVFITPWAYSNNGGADGATEPELGQDTSATSVPAIPLWFYIAVLVGTVLYELSSNLLFVSQMSMFARVSDPAIGGSYMTLLNTMANLGFKWASSLSLWLIDRLTWSECRHIESDALLEDVQCLSADASTKDTCATAGGQCRVIIDGYFVQLAACTVLGIVWLVVFSKTVRQLQDIPREDWLITKKSDDNNDHNVHERQNESFASPPRGGGARRRDSGTIQSRCDGISP